MNVTELLREAIESQKREQNAENPDVDYFLRGLSPRQQWLRVQDHLDKHAKCDLVAQSSQELIELVEKFDIGNEGPGAVSKGNDPASESKSANLGAHSAKDGGDGSDNPLEGILTGVLHRPKSEWISALSRVDFDQVCEIAVEIQCIDSIPDDLAKWRALTTFNHKPTSNSPMFVALTIWYELIHPEFTLTSTNVLDLILKINGITPEYITLALAFIKYGVLRQTKELGSSLVAWTEDQHTAWLHLVNLVLIISHDQVHELRRAVPTELVTSTTNIFTHGLFDYVSAQLVPASEVPSLNHFVVKIATSQNAIIWKNDWAIIPDGNMLILIDSASQQESTVHVLAPNLFMLDPNELQGWFLVVNNVKVVGRAIRFEISSHDPSENVIVNELMKDALSRGRAGNFGFERLPYDEPN